MIKSELCEKQKPLPVDYEVAEKKNPDWATLTTRKRNALATDEMFHRQYHALSEAIMGVRKP